MKKIVIAFTVGFLLVFSGCGNKEQKSAGNSYIKVGNVLSDITLNDQFGKPHTIAEGTEKVIFVFQKGTGHLVKSFFNKQPKNYFAIHNIQFIADVSPMPALIRDYVALPDLQEHEYPVMLITDEAIAAKYKDASNIDTVTVATLKNKEIIEVRSVATEEALKQAIE